MVGNGTHHTLDHMERQIEAEFLDEVRDVVNSLDILLGNLRAGEGSAVEALATLKRNFVSLEARGKGVDQPIISIVAYRGLEYLTDLKGLTTHQIDDIQKFIDRMRAVADGETTRTVDIAPKIVRELPVKRSSDFDIGDVRQLDIESMVIAPDKSTLRLVSRELAACGYRVSTERTSLRGIELIARTRPDFVIVSAVLDELTGIDVTSAIAAMPSTRTIPTALLTSYSWGHPSLHDLPTRVAIIRKGNQFGADLAEFLTRFGIA